MVNKLTEVDVQKLSVLKSVWSELKDNVLYDEALVRDTAVNSVKWLAKKINVNVQESTWAKTLQELFEKATLSKNVSTRVAAAGIARSFSILGTTGALSSKTKEDKALCLQARKIGDVYLRSLSHNFLVRFADWIREKITNLLVQRSVLPSAYEDACHRRLGTDARAEDGFDAVLDFTEAGLHAHVPEIEACMKKELAWRESLLKSVEQFLHDVLSPSLSDSEDVAQLQMRWRLLTRAIDECLTTSFKDKDNKKLKNYALQFNWAKNQLAALLKNKHWKREDEEEPYFRAPRCLNGRTENEVLKPLLKRIREANLIQGPILVVTLRE
jgi:hypothetical protein